MELLDIYDENGKHIGTEDRKIVHEKALWHKTVHCWLYDNNGNVFFKEEVIDLFQKGSGEIDGVEITKNEKTNIINKKINIDEFLINDGETLLEKYGNAFKKIIEVTQ